LASGPAPPRQWKSARAQYGRTALAEIAREVDGKTEEEVRAYAKAFWERYKELNEWDKVIKNIERGEQRIQRQKARAPAREGVGGLVLGHGPQRAARGSSVRGQ